eukprot:TRINITY_DN11285_c0_g1_i2.p1 TRINITY_DN11285_c0_g1~~TRINITY_DN11285_c0_g1_i2.p1  ORF type:complete len:375 (+),score=53.07 TRINITY_DN11285_c0_g1_i2:120-1127(+)
MESDTAHQDLNHVRLRYWAGADFSVAKLSKEQRALCLEAHADLLAAPESRCSIQVLHRKRCSAARRRTPPSALFSRWAPAAAPPGGAPAAAAAAAAPRARAPAPCVGTPAGYRASEGQPPGGPPAIKGPSGPPGVSGSAPPPAAWSASGPAVRALPGRDSDLNMDWTSGPETPVHPPRARDGSGAPGARLPQPRGASSSSRGDAAGTPQRGGARDGAMRSPAPAPFPAPQGSSPSAPFGRGRGRGAPRSPAGQQPGGAPAARTAPPQDQLPGFTPPVYAPQGGEEPSADYGAGWTPAAGRLTFEEPATPPQPGAGRGWVGRGKPPTPPQYHGVEV